MDRLHVLATTSSAPVADGDVRASFGYRPWWYDVHQVEGAV
jgi:hypothetical protein